MRFGVNYTPSAGWFYSWLQPDWDSVRRDLEAIAGLGLDHVRILPLWPVLQPNRALVRPQALQDVRTMVEHAASVGLESSVDILQGHLSSFDFLPSWLTSWHSRNMFTDPLAIDGQVQLVRQVHSALADAPGFLGLTLGNEVNQFSDRPHPTPMPARADQVETWLTALLDGIPSWDRSGRGRHHLHAEYDAVWYLDGHPFQPAHASRIGDMTAIHSWIFNGTAQHYGALSPESLRHAEYLIELSRAFATDPDRMVWLQEIGAPLNCLAPQQAPEFCERALGHALDTTGLWGVTWWCSHDVSRGLADFPELEYSLGLFDEHGQAKPIARGYARLAELGRSGQLGACKPRTLAVVVPVDQGEVPLRRADLAPGGCLFETWMALAKAGQRPTLVTSTTASDPGELVNRGIVETVPAGTGHGSVYMAVSEG